MTHAKLVKGLLIAGPLLLVTAYDDLLTDLITEAASNDYQPANQAANSTYIAELISDFEAGVKDERAARKPRSQR